MLEINMRKSFSNTLMEIYPTKVEGLSVGMSVLRFSLMVMISTCNDIVDEQKIRHVIM